MDNFLIEMKKKKKKKNYTTFTCNRKYSENSIKKNIATPTFPLVVVLIAIFIILIVIDTDINRKNLHIYI